MKKTIMIRTTIQALHKSINEIQHCIYLANKHQTKRDEKVLELIGTMQTLLQELLTIVEKKEQ